MPYDTVGGFPPLPTQISRGTIYEPKQDISFLHLQRAQLHTVGGASTLHEVHLSPTHSSSYQSFLGASPTELPKKTVGILPEVSKTSSPNRSAQSSCHSVSHTWRDDNKVARPHTYGEHNPWSMRATLADLDEQRQHNLNGVAAFRPICYVKLAMPEQQASDSVVPSTCPSMQRFPPTVKPLLEPFTNARELAQQASEETWYTRRLRYMQWLRKGALAAKKKQDKKEEQKNEVSPLPGDILSCVSRPMLVGGANQHFLPPLDRSMTWRDDGKKDTCTPEESTCVSGKSGLNYLQTSRLEESAFPGFQPITFALNPNEMAVRQLFHLAQGAGLTPTSGPWAGSRRGVDGSNDDCAGASGRTRRSSAALFTAVSPRAGLATSVSHVIDAPQLADGHIYFDENDLSFSPALRDDQESADSDDTPSSTSKSTVEPPPEYAVASLLRKRMHNTVATFTASSVHALDVPPLKTTRRLLGQARLQCEDSDKNASQRNSFPLANSGHHVQMQKEPVDEASVGQQKHDGVVLHPRQQRLFSSRRVHHLIYEETYERGLLSQFAFQSSPTRWYSSELPSGQDGIAFRKAYGPTMLPDDVLRARLHSATAHAIRSFALPRQEEAVQMAERHRQWMQSLRANSGVSGRQQQRLLLGSNTAVCVDAIDRSPLLEFSLVTIEEAAHEKATLFEQWTRLHRNLSAPWQLFRDEQIERLRLLGHFVSCTYPAPCICLECDQEVLNMSAIPLEPTVKSLCWYTSVVLSGHHDVLQKEMLRQHEEGLAAMYAEFRVLFIATYTREKLLEEEARRFGKMMRYHEFCLRVATQNTATAHASANRKNDSAATSAGVTTKETEQDAQSLTGTDPRMWRLRQRRLQDYQAFDSPFFSYLVYTEMITVKAAEDQVRHALEHEEGMKRKELVTLMRTDEEFSAFLALERRQRSWIFAEMVEAHSAMLTGPLVQLHAAHMAELRDKETAAHAKVCAREQQSFVSAAYAEKHAAAEANYAAFKMRFRELRQEFLTLLVANRSTAGSVELSRNWLLEQRQNVVVRTEQRLRDQLILHEEPAAFQAIADASGDSLSEAVEREAQRRVREDAEAAAAAAEAARVSAQARARLEAAMVAQQEWEKMRVDPLLRPSAKLHEDSVNSFKKLTMTLNEDFAFFRLGFD